MKQSCLILIDGSNFYFKLKSLGIKNLLNFKFDEFSKYIADEKSIISTTYYVGRIKQDGTTKTDKLLASQQKLISKFRKQKIKYKLGYLLKSDNKYHEKGVDVRIAVDMVSAAYEKITKNIMLISSDTDLEPVIEKVQQKGIPVTYLVFKYKPSIAMKRFCDKTRLLTKEELEQFLPQ